VARRRSWLEAILSRAHGGAFANRQQRLHEWRIASGHAASYSPVALLAVRSASSISRRHPQHPDGIDRRKETSMQPVTLLRPSRRAALALAAAVLLSSAALAQGTADYPAKPIKWVAPYPVGGGLDAVTRMYASEMAPKLGQPLVVDNRAGAGGTIGAAYVAKAPADGYTIMTIDSNSFATANLLYRKLPYNSLQDIQLVATLVRLPIVIAVARDHPAKNLNDLLQELKANPGRATFATPGVGSPQHAFMELFQVRTGTKAMHVPYKGMPSMLTDLSSGQVEIALSDFGSIKPFIESGKVRALAAATDARLPMLPDVPTFEELGIKDYKVAIWHSLAVPTGTPPRIVERLASLAVEAAKSPQIRQQLAVIGGEPIVLTGEAAGQFGSSQVALWESVLKPLDLRLD
jgi:tripartite-type tricarboxylate transporter receptor subunit TctC